MSAQSILTKSEVESILSKLNSHEKLKFRWTERKAYRWKHKNLDEGKNPSKWMPEQICLFEEEKEEKTNDLFYRDEGSSKIGSTDIEWKYEPSRGMAFTFSPFTPQDRKLTSDQKASKVYRLAASVLGVKESDILDLLVVDSVAEKGLTRKISRKSGKKSKTEPLPRVEKEPEVIPEAKGEVKIHAQESGSSISPVDLQVKKSVRQSAMCNIGMEHMDDILGKVKTLLWAQWQDARYMTSRQVADFLGLSERALDRNYQRNRDEFNEAREVIKLEGQELKEFKEVTNSELVTSGKPILNKFTPTTNLYSMPGVLRMAWISESPVAKEVRNASIALISNIPQMVQQGTENGRNQALETVSSDALTHGVLAEALSGIEANTACLPGIKDTLVSVEGHLEVMRTVEFFRKKRILSACGEGKIIDTLFNFNLPPITDTETDEPIWMEWYPKKSTKVVQNIIYMIFVDLHRRGRLTHLFSIGESGIGSDRLNPSHERIKYLLNLQHVFRVFYWLLEDSAFNHRETRRQQLEQPLQAKLRPVWDVQWDAAKKKEEMAKLL